jgi:hypothetical protein
MPTNRLAKIFALAWLFAPSVIWTFGLHAWTLCGDPFILQAVDRRLNPKVALLLRVLWVVFFAIALLQSWNISPGTYSFYFREALPYSPTAVLVSLGGGALLLISFALCLRTATLPKALSNLLVQAGLLLLIGKLIIVSFGFAPYIQQYVRFPSVTVARLGIKTLKPNSSAIAVSTPEATFNAFVRRGETLPKKIVLMIVESWAEAPTALSQIAAGIASEGFPVIRSGFTTYKGGTLSGEFRELCSEYLLPADGLREASARYNCAPRMLKQMGYDVLGVHGYNKSFYARDTFWQRFGFTRSIFREQFPPAVFCPGAFDGVCDDELIHRGVGLLTADENPRFVYMLTLSSHEPLAQKIFARHAAYLNAVATVHPTQVIARRAISDLMAELKGKKNSGCTLVHVVGDHQPRTGLVGSMEFPSYKVPYVSFLYNCRDSVTRFSSTGK